MLLSLVSSTVSHLLTLETPLQGTKIKFSRRLATFKIRVSLETTLLNHRWCLKKIVTQSGSLNAKLSRMSSARKSCFRGKLPDFWRLSLMAKWASVTYRKQLSNSCKVFMVWEMTGLTSVPILTSRLKNSQARLETSPSVERFHLPQS